MGKILVGEVIKTILAGETVQLYSMPAKREQIELQSIRLGDAVIIGFPCEPFVEFGLELKEQSPFAFTMISTLTNGEFGYVATREAYKNGGYETTATSITYLEEEAAYKMVEMVKKQLVLLTGSVIN